MEGFYNMIEMIIKYKDDIAKIVNDYFFLEMEGSELDSLLKKVFDDCLYSNNFLKNLVLEFDNITFDKLNSDELVDICNKVLFKNCSIFELCDFLDKYEIELNDYDTEIIFSASMDTYDLFVLFFKNNKTEYLSDSFIKFKNYFSFISKKNDNNGAVDTYKNYIKSINQATVLTDDEIRDVFVKYRNSTGSLKEKYKCIIVNNYLKLVVRIAKKFTSDKLEYEDFIQEGNIALLDAIERFDLTKNVKFTTYAYKTIESKMAMAFYLLGTDIRIPYNRKLLLVKLKKISSSYNDSYGVYPTAEVLSELSSVPIKKVKDIMFNNLVSDGNTTSLHSLVGIEGDNITELIDFLPSDSLSPSEIFLNNEVIETVNYFIENADIPDRDREILKYRFGFYNNKEYSLCDIANMFSLSNQSIRNIINKSLLKLKKDKLFSTINVYDSSSKSKITPSSFNLMPTVYEDYPSYSKEDIDFVLDNLSNNENSFFIIANRYGCDFDHKVFESFSKSFQSNILKSKKLLTYHLEKYTINKLAYKKRELVTNKTSHTTIYEDYYMYSKKIINSVIKDISLDPYNYSLLTMRYGNDFKKNMVDLDLSSSAFNEGCEILKKLLISKLNEKNISLPKKTVDIKTVYEEFPDYSVCDINTVLLFLSRTKKGSENILKRYGTDFNIKFDYSLNTDESFKKIVSALKSNIKKLLFEYTSDPVSLFGNEKFLLFVNSFVSDIYTEYFDVDRDVLDNVINYLIVTNNEIFAKRYNCGPFCINTKNDFEIFSKAKDLIAESINMYNVNPKIFENLESYAIIQKNMEMIINEFTESEKLIINNTIGRYNFNYELVGELLGISPMTVAEVTKKALLLYKEKKPGSKFKI